MAKRPRRPMTLACKRTPQPPILVRWGGVENAGDVAVVGEAGDGLAAVGVEATGRVMSAKIYGHRLLGGLLKRHRGLSLLMCWSTIVFEVSFLVVLFSGAQCCRPCWRSA